MFYTDRFGNLYEITYITIVFFVEHFKFARDKKFRNTITESKTKRRQGNRFCHKSYLIIPLWRVHDVFQRIRDNVIFEVFASLKIDFQRV